MNPINAQQFAEHAAERRSELTRQRAASTRSAATSATSGRTATAPPRARPSWALFGVGIASVAALVTSVVAIAADDVAPQPLPAHQVPAEVGTVSHVDCAHPPVLHAQRCI